MQIQLTTGLNLGLCKILDCRREGKIDPQSAFKPNCLARQRARALSGPATNTLPSQAEGPRQLRSRPRLYVWADGARAPGGQRAESARLGEGRGLTVAARLVRAVLAVGLAVTAQPQVHALAPRTRELGGRAHRAALLVALVVTLREAVAAPGPRNAVDLPSGARELVGGARRRLWGGEEDHHRPPRWAKTGRNTSGFQSGEHAQFTGAAPTRSPLPCVLSASHLQPPVCDEAVDPGPCARPGYRGVSTAPPPGTGGSESGWSAPHLSHIWGSGARTLWVASEPTGMAWGGWAPVEDPGTLLKSGLRKGRW